MLTSQIRQLFDYNHWANEIILDAAENLSHEQFLASSRFPRGGMRDTLFHLYYAEWIWRHRCQGSTPVPSVPKAADFRNLAELRAAWQREEQAMADYLAQLNDEALLSRACYFAGNGSQYSGVLVDFLTHLVIHGMQHRAEAAQILTEFGQSPGDIDYLFYCRDIKS